MDTQQQYGYNQQWQNDIPKFEGTSEQKTMYTQKVLPPIWRHPALKYEKNPNKFEGVSTQVTDYREFELQTRKLGGPHKNNLVVGGEFSSRTENHDQYPSRELPDPYRHPNAVYVKNPSKFEGVSTNSSDYREFELQMRKLGGPHKNNLDVGGEFSSRTENHDQYPPRELPDPYRHPNAVYVKNPNKFEGISTQVTDYREFELEARHLYGPHKNNLDVGGEFSSRTENHDQYPPRELPDPYRHANAAYVKNPNKFEGISTFNSDYGEYTIQARQRGGPHKNNIDIGGEFSSSTENHDQYPRRELPDPYRHPNAVYVKNLNKFEGVSTQVTDYREWQLPDRVICGPQPDNIGIGAKSLR